MKVALTLLVRDEADVLDAHLAFHLNAGVDVVVATDHRSTDGTAEVLERYARDGHVRLLREDARRIRQSEWVTRMARLAAVEHGADWVLNSDADEFWWPRGGSLKEALAAVPPRYGVVHALSRSFVPRPDDGTPFAERLIYRLEPASPINDPATSFRPVAKVAHRGDPNVVVTQGNHDAHSIVGEPLAGWYPLEIFHLPLRSRQQVERKHANVRAGWERNLRGDLSRARDVFEQGRPDAFYDRVAVDDEALGRGLADGSIVEDTRLRDALRALHSPDGGFVAAEERLVFAPPTPAEDAGHAIEARCFTEANLVRLRRRADLLEARLGRLETRRRVRFAPP